MSFFHDVRNILKKYIRRNKGLFSDMNRPVYPGKVNLHWWQISETENNIGDYISNVVVAYMKQINKIESDESHDGNTYHLCAIGSIIDGGYQDSTIWGSGVLSGNRKFWWRKIRKLDIRAVRGPETRQTLIMNGIPCPEIYGDPAILLPLIYSPKLPKKNEYRVIHNHAIEQAMKNELSPITDNWQEFIDEIVSSKLIISSSLHGIILAEAYGVPAVMLGTWLDLFKFRDYYHSTGRVDFPIAKSVEEALCIEPAPLPDIKHMQENLIKSFPKDLWKR